MRDRVKIVTLNVQGINNQKKRKTLIRLFKKDSINILALQETYLTSKDMDLVEKEWGGTVHMSEGSNRSKGLLTLFDKSFLNDDVTMIFKNDRMILSSVIKETKKYFIANIYSPCIEQDKERFLLETEREIKTHLKIEDWQYLICLGDFNTVSNNKLDIISGNGHPEITINRFNSFMAELDLIDIWREQHSNEKSHTWSRQFPLFIARRLDYILLAENLSFNAEDSYIKSYGFSDHRAVGVNLNYQTFKHGPSIYKINIELLKDTEYVNLINSLLQKSEDKFKDLDAHLKWEMIKVEIRELSQQYSRFRNSRIKNEKLNKLSELNELEEAVVNDPFNPILTNALFRLKKEAEISLINETRAAQIRCGVKWVEEGEKCTKFFLSLEKKRATSNTIYSLLNQQGQSTNTHAEVLEQICKYYELLYSADEESQDRSQSPGDFVKDLTLPKLQEVEKNLCESPLSENEVLLALKALNNKSAPGLDGLPAEFYKVFWNGLKKYLMDSYKYSFKEGALSPSQRQGVITLLHKGKELARDNLGNWRPISLTNTDYKILTKALAIRLGKVIGSLVSTDQAGFIKGRNISALLRELADIIMCEKYRKSRGIILAIDFRKAFDTISKRFMLDTFKFFGFGQNFMRWIEVLLNERTAVVKNGGYLSREFNLERGIRQGCPISPLIFVLAVEIMAIGIRQNRNIKGIKLPRSDQTAKVKQFADDTTLLLRDLMDFREVLSKIKQFSKCSGLYLNEQKCEAIIIGMTNRDPTEYLGIKIVNVIKILGMYFSNETSPEQLEENWTKRLESLERTLALWARRDLSIIGKIHILKTFGLSLFIYMMQSVGIPESTLNKINQMFFRFLWKKKFTNKKAFEKV